MISSLVIYRRKPKPKLICKDENEWKQIAQAISIGSQAEALLNGTYFEISTTDSEGSDSSESREHEKIKIVPRRLKRNVQQKDKVLLTKGEPVIFLTDDPTDLEEFEIVGGKLTKEEKRILQKKLIATCNALNID
uniref:Uncharacterized protein n=1 Tax=Panagrolaimus sp. JU765 TaxID=591449 RepID=A0AC34QKC3_9BILA